MNAFVIKIKEICISYLFQAFIINFIFSSQLFAHSAGWYLGGGPSLLTGYGKLDSYGTAHNFIQIKPPNSYNSSFSLDIFNGPSSQANQLTGVFNTNVGLSGLIGYYLPGPYNLGLGIQVSGVTNANLGNYYTQQVLVSPTITINNQPISLYSRITERHLYSYGFSLLPQKVLFEFMQNNNHWQTSLLLLLGYRYGLFQSTWDSSSPWTEATYFSSRTERNGLEIGLGFDISLTKKIDLRLMTSQTWYERKNIFLKAPNWHSQSTVQMNQVDIAFIWHL